MSRTRTGYGSLTGAETDVSPRAIARRASTISLMLLALLASACASRRALGEAEVRRITFDGNRGFLTDRSDINLRLVMTHPNPRFRPWPIRRRVGLDRVRLDADRNRVLTHLAHRGYFDADLDWRVVTHRPARSGRPEVVDVVGEMTLGPQTHITDVRVDGLEVLRPPGRRRTRRSASGSGEPFSLAIHEANLGAIRRTLQILGRPGPVVEGEVRIQRAERSATLVYDVTPGPLARLRDIVIEGLVDVPRANVERRVRLQPGARYDISALEKTRVRLYAMDVFSIVSVTPRATDDPELVDIVVRVEERPPRGVGVRSGIAIQSGRQEALVGLEVSHLNALRRLWRLSFDAEGGAAVVGSEIAQIGSLSELRVGPVADVTFDLSVPDLPVRTFDTVLQLGFEHTITEAFQTNRPSVSLVTTVSPRRSLTLSGGYRFDFVNYTDLQIEPEELDEPDLLDGQYRNAELRTRAVWDTRNDPLSPTRGHVVDLLAELAGTWLGGSYDYGGAQLDLRGYLGLGRRFDRLRRALGLRRNALVFAGRLGGGILLPYGPEDRATVPVAERLYLGGTGSVRGWTYQHLGPYVCASDEAACESAIGVELADDVDTVPIGGRVATWGSLEARQSFEWIRLVAFVDGGMVWSTLEDVARRRPLLSVGGGVRFLTPIGPIRVDVAARTDDPPEFRAQEPRWWVHVGLGEAF